MPDPSYPGAYKGSLAEPRVEPGLLVRNRAKRYKPLSPNGPQAYIAGFGVVIRLLADKTEHRYIYLP